jgi:nitrogen fixation/metabolism regulation signal transduction histidine kinase
MGTRTPRQDSRSGPKAAQRERAAALVPDLIVASTPPAGARRTVSGLLLRFISCGVLALCFGLIWRLTLAPAVIAPGSAFAGIFILLAGFILGGVLWYLYDARRRRRDPDSVSDERLVFSFIVFAVVPFGVLLLIGAVWLLALVIGAA